MLAFGFEEDGISWRKWELFDEGGEMWWWGGRRKREMEKGKKYY